MLGKVHGPYIRADGRQHVVIIHHNVDGSIKERKTVSYPKYLKEMEQGLHQYEDWIRPEPKRINISLNDQKYRSEIIITKCSCCQHDMRISRFFAEKEFHYCSKNCREKHKRKLNKRIKITYSGQYVVTINANKDNKHYVILERNERESYFISADKCKTFISEDNNKIETFHLVYDKKDAVRIRLVPGFKKFYWITETGILVSRRTRTIVSQTVSQNGYLTHATIIGGRSGKIYCFKIHRFVGLAFITNPENKPFINHIDGNKQNNHYLNLEWVTNLENIQHASAMGLMLQGTELHNSVFTITDVNRIRHLYDNKIMPVSDIIKEYKVSPHAVYDCVKYRTYKNVVNI